MKIALSPSIYEVVQRRECATRYDPVPKDVTIILKSDKEHFLRDNWRILKPIQVNSMDEALELLRKLEETESLE